VRLVAPLEIQPRAPPKSAQRYSSKGSAACQPTAWTLILIHMSQPVTRLQGASEPRQRSRPHRYNGWQGKAGQETSNLFQIPNDDFARRTIGSGARLAKPQRLLDG